MTVSHDELRICEGHAIIAAEIRNDPLGRGYMSHWLPPRDDGVVEPDHDAIAALLVEPISLPEPTYQPLDVAAHVIHDYLIDNDLVHGIEQVSADSEHAMWADAFRLLTKIKTGRPLKGGGVINSTLEGLRSAGLLTERAHSDLAELFRREIKVGRLEQLGVHGGPGAKDVEYAMELPLS